MYDILRVKMIRCIAQEPASPSDPIALEEWSESGNSARPVQEHIGDMGSVLWINEDLTLCIGFDDGDERILYPEEIEWITFPD